MGNCNKHLSKMKAILYSIIFLLLGSNSYCQNIIQSDTEITKIIKVNDTIDLQFIDWPSAGIGWKLYSDYDTTLISIKGKSSRLMDGDFPKGGRYINTIQYTGKNPGEVKLEYYWGRPLLKEKIYYCRIEINVK